MFILNRYNALTFTAMILIFTLLPFNMIAQDMYDLENELFSKLISYHNLNFKIDSLKKSIGSISKDLNELKKNKSKNEAQILEVLSTSVNSVNELKTRQDKLNRMNEDITSLRKRLYNIYDIKIDSLNRINNHSSENIAKQILDLTDKKLLVQPKMGVLSIDPLRLLNIKISEESPMQKEMVREYFSNAIAEVNSHLEIISNSIDETGEIIRLKEQTQNFLEESSFETETRPMNLFSNTNETAKTNDRDIEDTYTDIESLRGLNNIKNTTLLGADTFATILQQLSAFDNSVEQSFVSRYGNTDINISLEDYAELLNETRLRLQEYRSVLLKRIDLFNEPD